MKALSFIARNSRFRGRRPKSTFPDSLLHESFDVHALVGAEIQPLMRQPISSAQSVLTDVAPRGFSSDSVDRGGPGNSPSLYAAGGAHCNRLGPSR